MPSNKQRRAHIDDHGSEMLNNCGRVCEVAKTHATNNKQQTNKLAHVPANAHLRLHQKVKGVVYLFMTIYDAPLMGSVSGDIFFKPTLLFWCFMDGPPNGQK